MNCNRILLVFLFVITCACYTNAQVKQAFAVKVTTAPKLDGKLDDEAWQKAPLITNFTQSNPDYGKAPAKQTAVRIVYDDDAIYIGAFMYDSAALIRRQLTSRDQENFQDVDNFHVAFDTYNDNQNAFQFIVTSANVQSDVRISPNGSDYNWDAIWDSHTSINNDGWIAEIKIPYMALRFPKKNVQDWGVNFSRFIRRFNETSHWVGVDPKQNGYVNQFGDLKGLENIKPPLRLSFLPYVSAGYRNIPTNNGTIKESLRNGGMDVKYGINESFTLDMTLIPDFGQVRSDNVILNLSPFEQQFNENRPFFTEGTELFNKAGIFYSRRIGSMPAGHFDAIDYAQQNNLKVVKNPALTQLYNATKISGRTKSNLGIGFFNAVTAPMHATLEDVNGNTIEYQTAPLTNYNILVLDQALKNRSYVSFTNSNVRRADNSRNANVSAIDVSLYDKTNTYNLSVSGRFSSITGNNRYNGFKTGIDVSKVSGKWQYGIGNNIESDRYDPNDLGILRSPNEVTTNAYISFIQFNPNKRFNYRRYNLNLFYTSLYKPFSFQEFGIRSNFFHLFKNFWDVDFVVESNPVWFNDYFELRTPGRKLKRAPWVFTGIFGSTDSRKKLFVNFGFGFAESPVPDDAYFTVRGGARYRFSPKFSLEYNFNRDHDKGNFGFVYRNPSNNEPIIGKRQFYQVTSTLSGIYNFKPRMNLTLNARHYWSKVQYLSMFDVDADGHWINESYSSGYDWNFNVFNVDVFFTWDFRLGSRLVVAWKNALAPDATVDGTTYTKYTQNLFRIFSVPHSNEVSMKFIYFIDYNILVKKKTT